MRVPAFLRNRTFAFLHDLLMIPIAWVLSYSFIFGTKEIPHPFLTTALWALPLVMLVQAASFRFFGLYRGIWRFASIPDLIRILKSVITASLLTVFLFFLMTRLENFPRSIFPLYSMTLIFLLGTPRILYRWSKDRVQGHRPGQRVMIVGAGRAGEMLARDLLRDPVHKYTPILFADDDTDLIGKEIHGIPVRGPLETISELCAEFYIDVIILALPSATPAEMKRVVKLASHAHVRMRTLPALSDWVGGHVSIDKLRKVSISDLLGRDQVDLDWESLRAEMRGKCIMVTGAGGSIGHELANQIARMGPDRLILLDHCEHSLFCLENTLKSRFPSLYKRFVLINVLDKVAVSALIDQEKPDCIFHAAAYKHVPMLQYQMRESIQNNLLGTRVVADCADKLGVEKFVLISTDKAVCPTNVMGASKRAAEIYCHALNLCSETQFMTVRFGNVLGSSGSVVPFFEEQIRAGGPVTVTHPEITRYFMTKEEAALLILQASVQGEGGEIFVLDMGKPVKILYLAEQMIRLSGYEPGEDIEIQITGLRPGEKLHEELMYDYEKPQPTRHDKIMRLRFPESGMHEVEKNINGIEHAIHSNNHAELERLLIRLVPEYQKSSTSNIVPFQPKQVG